MNTAMNAMRTPALLGLSLVLLLTGTAPPPLAHACCMVPRTYPGDVDQSAQHVLVVHHEGHQELVIRVRPYFRNAEQPPDSLAWLITVPSAPTGYDTAAPDVFRAARALHEKLRDLYEQQRPRPLLPTLESRVGVAGEVDSPNAISIGATVAVGPYAITPVKALGATAVAELNRYLADNGFGTEDPKHLRWFAEHEFTFLCIKIRPPEGSARLGKHLDLPPLQIGFDSERPYYPGMYSSQQGDFALELTMLTSRPVARQSIEAIRRRLRAYPVPPNLFTVEALPEPFQSAVGSVLGEGGQVPSRWYVNRYDSHGVNPPLDDGRPAISEWTEDVLWELGDATDGPPSWYYGDGSRPLTHPHNIRLFLLIAGIAAVLTLLVLVARRLTRARAQPV